MKKVVLLAVMMVFMASMAWSAEICYTCPKKTDPCVIPTTCYPTQDQQACVVEEPCNVVVEICECVDPETGLTVFRENNTLGFKFLSMTPGVYFAYDQFYDLQVQLFAKEDGDLACAAKDPNYAWDDPTVAGYPGHVWDGVNSLYYLDNTGAKITTLDPNEIDGGTYDCDPQKIVGITTCLNKDNGGLPSQTYWTIDYKTTDYVFPVPAIQGDNDHDGFAGEDAIGWYGHLVVKSPKMTFNWDEIDPLLYGTYAKVRLYILQVTDLDSLCPGCEDLCYCEYNAVKLCDVETVSKCIYFQYALYETAGWESGIAITNTDITSVPIDEMEISVTVVDSEGAIHTATFADFEEPVTAFMLKQWIEDKFEMTDVAAGNVFVGISANFPIDAYEFFKYEMGDSSMGAGNPARQCCWPAVSGCTTTY